MPTKIFQEVGKLYNTLTRKNKHKKLLQSNDGFPYTYTTKLLLLIRNNY